MTVFTSVVGRRSLELDLSELNTKQTYREENSAIVVARFSIGASMRTPNIQRPTPLLSHYEANEKYDFERHMTKLLIVERETILNNSSLAHSTINRNEDFESCGICNIATPSEVLKTCTQGDEV